MWPQARRFGHGAFRQVLSQLASGIEEGQTQ